MPSKLVTLTGFPVNRDRFAPRTCALILVLVLFGIAPAAAQDPMLTANPDSALAVELDKIKGSPLALDQAFDLALERSTTIQEATYALVAAEQAVRREKGVFDPEVFANLERQNVNSPASSPFTGDESDETRITGGARMNLPLGTEVEVSLNTVKQETNAPFSNLNPVHSTFGVVSVRQPLLSGFGPSARAQLSLAERAREEAQAQYNNAVFEVRSRVEILYWDLYATERTVAVFRIITSQARSLLREAELRQAAGLGSANQVANAQTFLADQLQQQLDGEESLDLISDNLAALIGTRPENGFGRFHPQNTPPA